METVFCIDLENDIHIDDEYKEEFLRTVYGDEWGVDYEWACEVASSRQVDGAESER